MQILSFIGNILTELIGKTDNWRQIYKQTSSNIYTSNDVCLQNDVLREEKLLGRNDKGVSL